MKSVPKSVLSKIKSKYKTRRAMYRSLYKRGYSQNAIARAFNVSKRTIWMSLHSWSNPKEKI